MSVCVCVCVCEFVCVCQYVCVIARVRMVVRHFVCTSVYVFLRSSMCVCMLLRKRERGGEVGGERERETETDRQTDRQSLPTTYQYPVSSLKNSGNAKAISDENHVSTVNCL